MSYGPGGTDNCFTLVDNRLIAAALFCDLSIASETVVNDRGFIVKYAEQHARLRQTRLLMPAGGSQIVSAE